MQHKINVERQENGISFHISGPKVAKANTQMLNNCLTALVECAEKHDCFEKGFSAICLGTIAKHDAESHCVSKAFGLARA